MTHTTELTIPVKYDLSKYKLRGNRSEPRLTIISIDGVPIEECPDTLRRKVFDRIWEEDDDFREEWERYTE